MKNIYDRGSVIVVHGEVSYGGMRLIAAVCFIQAVLERPEWEIFLRGYDDTTPVFIIQCKTLHQA